MPKRSSWTRNDNPYRREQHGNARRALPAVAGAVVLAGAAAATWAVTRSSSSPRAAPIATSTSPANPTPAVTTQSGGSAPAPSGPTRAIQGPSEDMRWGPVQVTVILKGRTITDVKATAPTERARSAFINDQALPMLRQEVLQAQVANVKNIYGISGATLTSEAYYQSLMAALQQAHLVGQGS